MRNNLIIILIIIQIVPTLAAESDTTRGELGFSEDYFISADWQNGAIQLKNINAIYNITVEDLESQEQERKNEPLFFMRTDITYDRNSIVQDSDDLLHHIKITIVHNWKMNYSLIFNTFIIDSIILANGKYYDFELDKSEISNGTILNPNNTNLRLSGSYYAPLEVTSKPYAVILMLIALGSFMIWYFFIRPIYRKTKKIKFPTDAELEGELDELEYMRTGNGNKPKVATKPKHKIKKSIQKYNDLEECCKMAFRLADRYCGNCGKAIPYAILPKGFDE